MFRLVKDFLIMSQNSESIDNLCLTNKNGN